MIVVECFQATAQKVLGVQESVEISAIASCKKIDEKEETTTTIQKKAQKIVPVQEGVQVIETKTQETAEDFRSKFMKLRSIASQPAPVVQLKPVTVTQVEPETRAKPFELKKVKKETKAQKVVSEQESVTVSQVTAESTVKEFKEDVVEEKAVRKVSVQKPVTVSEVQAEETTVKEFKEEVKEEKALKKMPVQKPVTVSEVQSEATVKEFKEEIKGEKAKRVVTIQESVSISEIQSEATVQELQEKKPKARHAKPDKKPIVKETAVVTEVKTLTAEQILEEQETSMATEVEELMKFVKVKEFGPGESPLRELAKIGFLVRQGVSVNEITTLYEADRFPALRTPEAQSAMVQLVEREGHGALISEVLTEESTTDEDVVASTVGFRAFMKMVELKHARVEQVITHFAPEDFRSHAWETSEATQVRVLSSVEENVMKVRKLRFQVSLEQRSLRSPKPLSTTRPCQLEPSFRVIGLWI